MQWCVCIYIYYMLYCTKIVARWPRWSQRLEIWDRGKIRGRKGATRDIDWNTTSVGGRARIHRWCPLLLLGWHPQMWISKWRTAPTDVWLVNFSTGHVSGKWWYPMVHGLYYIWLYYDYILCIYIYISHTWVFDVRIILMAAGIQIWRQISSTLEVWFGKLIVADPWTQNQTLLASQSRYLHITRCAQLEISWWTGSRISSETICRTRTHLTSQ